VALVRNGVDLDRFHPAARRAARGTARQALGLDPGQLALVSVGSGFGRKGVATIVRALGYLRRQGRRPDPVLLVAGRGASGPLERLAARERVRDQVRFLGPVEDPLPLYAAADVFVLPSLYDPASNATLEALATGLAVITTPRNGTAELLAPGRSGWVLGDPGDARELARLLEEAAGRHDDPALAEAARAAVEPWTWSRHVAETVELYASMAGQARGGGATAAAGRQG
jgi:UDP-glucose:(heptosyl)LPS alpha-1,3-glucosyltransferase